MKTIKRIMAALICMTIALTGIPISVKAADSSGTLDTNMETNSELFITLEENTDYRWNVNDSGEKGSDVHLDTGEGGNCRFRLDKIENGWYGIKHIKVNGTDRFADVEDESKDSGARYMYGKVMMRKSKEKSIVNLHFIILEMMQTEIKDII